jgi:hypothetical protein
MGWETEEEGAGLLWWGVYFPLMEEGRKGQRVGASLGSLGMSHREMEEWRVDRLWRSVVQRGLEAGITTTMKSSPYSSKRNQS